MDMSVESPYKRSYHHELPTEHECGDADLTDLMRELQWLDEDPTLPKLTDPAETTLREILERAATYTGPWYHARVMFSMDAPVGDGYRDLRQLILDLPASAGVSWSLHYEAPELAALFDQTP